MTETINQIKDELARIIVKIAELLGLRSKISVELQTLQDRFIAGEIDAETLQAEQGKLADTDGLVAALEVRKSKLERDLSTAVSSSAHSGRILHLKAIASQAKADYDAYLRARLRIDLELQTAAAELFEKRSALIKQKKAFLSEIREILPDVYELATVSMKDRSAYQQIINEIEMPEAIGVISDRHIRLQPTDFGESVSNIEGLYTARQNRLKRDAEKRRVAARTEGIVRPSV